MLGAGLAPRLGKQNRTIDVKCKCGETVRLEQLTLCTSLLVAYKLQPTTAFGERRCTVKPTHGRTQPDLTRMFDFFERSSGRKGERGCKAHVVKFKIQIEFEIRYLPVANVCRNLISVSLSSGAFGF